MARKSIDKSMRNARGNQSFMNNISVSSKVLSKGDQSNAPTQYMTMTNNFMSSTGGDKQKRIYSAKPILNDSRKFLGGKIPETNYIRFSTQTAPSTTYTKMKNASMTGTNNWVNDAWATTYKMNSRSTESSLSNLTHAQNNQTLTQLDVLERIREKEAAVNELTNIKHIDCKKLLMNANKQLKKVNYKLKNLISNGESHVELVQNNPQDFEIFDEIPLYCKLKCKNHAGPARFVIKFTTKGRVKSYVSTKISVPPVFKTGKKLDYFINQI
jgi:hypothetical protein